MDTHSKLSPLHPLLSLFPHYGKTSSLWLRWSQGGVACFQSSHTPPRWPFSFSDPKCRTVNDVREGIVNKWQFKSSTHVCRPYQVKVTKLNDSDVILHCVCVDGRDTILVETKRWRTAGQRSDIWIQSRLAKLLSVHQPSLSIVLFAWDRFSSMLELWYTEIVTEAAGLL